MPRNPGSWTHEYSVGQRVAVHAMGTWYVGAVVKVGPKRVACRYTSGAGTTRDKACTHGLIAPLAGERGVFADPGALGPLQEAERARARAESDARLAAYWAEHPRPPCQAAVRVAGGGIMLCKRALGHGGACSVASAQP